MRWSANFNRSVRGALVRGKCSWRALHALFGRGASYLRCATHRYGRPVSMKCLTRRRIRFPGQQREATAATLRWAREGKNREPRHERVHSPATTAELLTGMRCTTSSPACEHPSSPAMQSERIKSNEGGGAVEELGERCSRNVVAREQWRSSSTRSGGRAFP